MPEANNQSALSLRNQPFLYLTAALVVGIVADRWKGISPIALLTSGCFCVGLAIAWVLLKKERLASVMLVVCFALGGAFISYSERRSEKPSPLSMLHESGRINPEQTLLLTGELEGPPEPAPDSSFLDLSVETVSDTHEVFSTPGRVRLSVSFSDHSSRDDLTKLSLNRGSRIRVLATLDRARKYLNPGSPDFNEFLERRGYDLKGIIRDTQSIEFVSEGPPSLVGLLYRLRQNLIAAIDARFKSRYAGMLKAMLAGNRYFLDRETTERLRGAATFHTVVIAGLHIGIIAWVLLGGRSALKRRSIWRVSLCLGVLWGYAVMVGLAPPVNRAATMLTIGLIGPVLFRRAASVNTLALSAFVMLLVKPALVADPGFQLSFAAVAGIVGLALPVTDKLRRIGVWRPTSHTPHPPECPRVVRAFAEILFWDARSFETEMKRSAIKYRLVKHPVARVLSRWRIQAFVRSCALLIITSTAIQLMTLPLMALYFNRVAPIGILLNVFAGLFTAVLMFAGLATLAVAPISPFVASMFEHVVNITGSLLVNSLVPFAELPLATFRVAHYEGAARIIYAAYFIPFAMLAILLDRWRAVDYFFPFRSPTSSERETAKAQAIDRSRLPLPSAGAILCVFLLIVLIALVLYPPIKFTPGKLTVHFLDVGQGDSALVVFPRGKTLLIDGGGEIQFSSRRDTEENQKFPEVFAGEFSIGEAVVSRFIWSLGRTRLDYVLATHAHADHIGGLSDVLRNMDVREALVGYAVPGEYEYDRFAASAGAHGTPIFTVGAGQRFAIDGVAVEVLWPPRKPLSAELTSGNDDSVVLRLVYGSTSILLAGDIEEKTERALVQSGVNLHADVLKVPHHGSKTSSTEEFINAVDPKYAIVSVGAKSRFGHPHSSVVDRYAMHAIKLLQTGREGMVTLESDGSGKMVPVVYNRASSHFR